MMSRCGAVPTNASIAAWSVQADSVQNVRRPGWATSDTPIAPGDRRTWRAPAAAAARKRGHGAEAAQLEAGREHDDLVGSRAARRIERGGPGSRAASAWCAPLGRVVSNLSLSRYARDG